MADLTHLRRDYCFAGLVESCMLADPIEQFRQWLGEALTAEVHEPYAMTLATANAEGAPSARIVLLRKVDERGFIFFTNYRSRKGSEMAANPRAALVFYWPELERQVRIEGTISLVDDETSDRYFHQRPIGSQIAAVASPQSEVLPDRLTLDQRVEALTDQFADQEVPRPPHWGGYALLPQVMEFWQGRPNRLHDRLRYRRVEQSWLMDRLAP
jgi:pyridoxamine 5'-phosphate oxidase